MAKVKITQIRSQIKRPANQKATLTALKLGRINKSVELELNPSIQGMINTVKHLVTVEQL